MLARVARRPCHQTSGTKVIKPSYTDILMSAKRWGQHAFLTGRSWPKNACRNCLLASRSGHDGPYGAGRINWKAS